MSTNKILDPVAVTDNGGNLSIDDGGNSITVDGTVTVTQATATNLKVDASGVAVPVTDNAGSLTVDNAGTFAVQVDAALPAGTNAIGKLAANSGVDIGDVDVTSLPALVAGTANIGDVDVLTVPAPLSTTGSGTEATALRVTVATDSTGVVSVDDNGSSLTVDGTVGLTKAATGTGSNVSGSASSVTLLSANASRLGATIYNDSTAVLYVKFGTTASATDFLVKMAAGGYFELPGPYVYTGRIDGIWASATGAARIVELT